MPYEQFDLTADDLAKLTDTLRRIERDSEKYPATNLRAQMNAAQARREIREASKHLRRAAHLFYIAGRYQFRQES